MDARWQPRFDDDPLWPSSTPLVMAAMTTEVWPPALRGWALGAASFGRAPQASRLADGLLDVLAPGGTSILQQRLKGIPLDEANPVLNLAFDGIYRIDVATGVERRAGFEPRDAEQISQRAMAASPGGESAVIVDGWLTEQEPRPDTSGIPGREAARIREEYFQRQIANTRLTVHLVSFDGAPAREITTIEGGTARGPDSVSHQWSPDGRLMAINLRPRTKRLQVPDVHVYDTRTWEVIARYENAELEGSASWGPDSDRLLLSHLVGTTWVQHLDGTRQPVTVLPEPISMEWRPIRPLGMADNSHLLTLQANKRKSTLMRTSISTGDHEGLVGWTGHHLRYPVLAQMPPAVWA